ncbi:MAG: ATP-binding protein [Deltaproteobacteria bacterium]|nr:ATP-binding protein [Deltaproteobacteria bacterium]
MTLSKKTFIIVCVTFIGLMAVLYFITSNILSKGFDVIEDDSIKNNVERVRSAIDYECEAVDTTAGDYAGWDDTYVFVQKKNEKYINANMNNTTFAQLKVNVVIILNKKGEVVFSTGYDRKEDKQIALSSEIMEHVRVGSFLASHESIKSNKKGILLLKNGSVILASRPILTSKYTGPIMGTLIMGRNLDEDIIQKWSKLTRTVLSLQPLSNDGVGKKKEATSVPADIIVKEISSDIIEGETQIYDVYGAPAYLLSVRMPRPVYLQEQRTTRYLIASSLAVFMIFALAIIWLLKKSIIARLVKIGQDVNKIGTDADFSARITVAGKDELTRLGSEINGMIEKLEESTQELRETHNTLYQTNQVLLEQIEERQRTEAALRQSEERFSAVFKASPTPKALVVANDATVLDVNERFTRLFGYAKNEILGQKSEDVLQIRKDEWNGIVEKLRKMGFLRDEYSRVVTKGGDIRECLISAEQVSLGDEEVVILSLQDMTEYKRMEIRLQRAQKMEALGVLAGGVAHDLNNVLVGLVGYPEMLMMQLSPDSPLRRHLLTIQNSGSKAAAIVQDLLTLARRGVQTDDVAHLNRLISEYLASPEQQRLVNDHQDINVMVDLSEDLLPIRGSAVHLQKTIMNLVLNAAEAMSAGGTIRLATRNQYIDKPVAGYDDVREGEYVVMEISDTGHGIAPGDLEHIFEPFYTKKVMGKSGTGLGLAVVWGTVKDHNGYVDVRSKEEEGTSFTIYLPAARDALPSSGKSETGKNILGKGENILVVDDIKVQRDLAKIMLSSLGYNVSTVSSGEEAIAYLKQHTVDLLILDMIMEPGMDGLDTYRHVLKNNPRQKAIIASGFSETERVREAQRLGVGAYVRKPYILEQIGMAVRKELDLEN